jgi:hypothetical protein
MMKNYSHKWGTIYEDAGHGHKHNMVYQQVLVLCTCVYIEMPNDFPKWILHFSTHKNNFQVQKIGFFCEAATKTSFDNWSN